MPQITHIRTPIDPELLKKQLAELCGADVQVDVVGHEQGALGSRNVICVAFSAEEDYPMLAEAIRRAHAVMQARDADGSTG